MLLFQGSILKGAVSLLFHCGLYSDLVEVAGSEEKKRYSLLLDLGTPIPESYPSEMCVMSVSQGLHRLGRYGYCDDVAQIKGREHSLADATLYLETFGIIVVA
jgi:hypothetical protein